MCIIRVSNFGTKSKGSQNIFAALLVNFKQIANKKPQETRIRQAKSRIFVWEAANSTKTPYVAPV